MDLPRGWTLSADANPGTASITVPAIAGVSHVLDAVTVKIHGFNGSAAYSGAVLVTSSDGAYTNFPVARVSVTAAAAASLQADAAAIADLGLAAGAGASLTVAVSPAAGAGITQTLVIQGHDV